MAIPIQNLKILNKIHSKTYLNLFRYHHMRLHNIDNILYPTHNYIYTNTRRFNTSIGKYLNILLAKITILNYT